MRTALTCAVRPWHSQDCRQEWLGQNRTHRRRTRVLLPKSPALSPSCCAPLPQTTIECLKMACTGELPPNCKSGQAFINDPNLHGSTEVRGVLSLAALLIFSTVQRIAYF